MTETTPRLRRAGARWRLLVHEHIGLGYYGKSHDVRGDLPYHGERASEWEQRHVIPNTEFDELVVGQWLHVEQMGDTTWWMDIGGVVVDIKVDRDGKPKAVLVQCEPVDGVTYEWAGI